MVRDPRAGMRPHPTLGRRFDVAARRAFPSALTILLMFLTGLPFGFAGQSALLPALALGCVWSWSLWRPASLSSPMVFAIGLLLDLLGYQPLGVGVLCLLLAHGAAVRWRQPLLACTFGWVWLAYLPIASLAAGLTWALTAALTARMIPAGPALFQAAVSAAVYPVLAIPLAHAHRGIAEPERA